MKFVVTGLPRSRTKWASVFLSTPDCPVIHDATFQQMETACAVSTPVFLQRWQDYPDVKVALIYRPLSQVLQSMAAFGNHAAWVMNAYDSLVALRRQPNVKTFHFHELDARALWEYCHETEVSDEYIQVFEDMNIQQAAMEHRRIA